MFDTREFRSNEILVGIIDIEYWLALPSLRLQFSNDRQKYEIFLWNCQMEQPIYRS